MRDAKHILCFGQYWPDAVILDGWRLKRDEWIRKTDEWGLKTDWVDKEIYPRGVGRVEKSMKKPHDGRHMVRRSAKDKCSPLFAAKSRALFLCKPLVPKSTLPKTFTSYMVCVAIWIE